MHTRRWAFGAVLGSAIALVAVGCKDRTRVVTDAGSDASRAPVDAGADVADAADADAPDAAGPNAANELLVARYEDESPAEGSATLKAPAPLILSVPKGGVALSLRVGEVVTLMAERNGFYRATAPDPKDPTRRLMGWVARLALEERLVGPKTPLVPRCLQQQVFVLQETALLKAAPATSASTTAAPAPPPAPAASGAPSATSRAATPRCDYVCNADRECVGSNKCEVAAVLEGGKLPEVPSYTTVCTPLSDPTKARVSGGGVRSLFGIPHPGSGKCPRGFVSAPKVGDLCYRGCKIDDECPIGSSCKSIKGTKLCSVN